jgi:hypothetical protein
VTTPPTLDDLAADPGELLASCLNCHHNAVMSVDPVLERFPIRLNRAARISAAYVADCLGGMCNLIGDCSKRVLS